MNFYLFTVLSYSIFIAAGIGLYRFRKISKEYYPFIFYTVIASINEIYSTIIVTRFGLSTNANNNTYTLLEALIITWQFHKWNFFAGRKWQYWLLQSLFIFVWLYDYWYFKNIGLLFHRFRIYAASAIVLLSLAQLSRLIYGNEKKLLKNTCFIVCCGFILMFTFKIITELFWLYGIHNSNAFLYKVYEWFGYINFFINLLFILAVIWIPKKPPYITFT